MFEGERVKEFKRLMKINKKEILKGTFLYSLISILINILIGGLGIPEIGLFVFIVIWLLYYFQIHHFVEMIMQSKDNKASWKMFLSLPASFSVGKTTLILINYVFLVVIGYSFLRLSMQLEFLGILFILFLPFIFVLVNTINHTIMFKKDNTFSWIEYFKTVSSILKERKVLIFNVLQITKTVFIGAIIIILINIFLMGPQLQSALALPTEQSSMTIHAIFSNRLSGLIQGVGAQTLLFYLFFVTALIVKSTENKGEQKNIYRKKLRKKKKVLNN